jgi:hypothetical protein
LGENVKILPRTLETRELAVASQQRTVSHSLSTRKLLTKNNMTAVTHPPYFTVSSIEDKTEKETTSRVMVGCRPKASLLSDGSTSPGNNGWLFVTNYIQTIIGSKRH